MSKVGKFLLMIGKDILSGVKKIAVIFAVCVCAVSVLMSGISLGGGQFPGLYMPAVYAVAVVGLAYFYGYILREVAKECTWQFSLNVSHLLVVLITFAFFFFMALMCVGATTVFDVWIGEKLTLGQVLEQRTVFENISMYVSFVVLALFVSTPLISYVIDVCERLNKEK